MHLQKMLNPTWHTKTPPVLAAGRFDTSEFEKNVLERRRPMILAANNQTHNDPFCRLHRIGLAILSV